MLQNAIAAWTIPQPQDSIDWRQTQSLPTINCTRVEIIVKPSNFAKLKRSIQTIMDYWFEVNVLPNYGQKLS